MSVIITRDYIIYCYFKDWCQKLSEKNCYMLNLIVERVQTGVFNNTKMNLFCRLIMVVYHI